ncbi:MAG: c-type cytochrome [Acidobacteria bacterium]|nr:c-type cytochrome [Acidobacteriota bacterium]
MNKNVVLLIVGFVVGFIISFLYFNAQYQAGGGVNTSTNQATESAEPTTTNKTPSPATASKTGALEAFGAKKSEESSPETPPAESVYKNIQVLKGVPSDQVLTVMKAFTEGLGVNCVYCHVSTDELAKDDKAMKQTARKMLEMVKEMNKAYPTNGQVTCYTCHRGAAKPVS